MQGTSTPAQPSAGDVRGILEILEIDHGAQVLGNVEGAYALAWLWLCGCDVQRLSGAPEVGRYRVR